tara:strand:+ start:116 stop:670 length:555 start_codon:yes stop_codon:yes gene_type:complete
MKDLTLDEKIILAVKSLIFEQDDSDNKKEKTDSDEKKQPKEEKPQSEGASKIVTRGAYGSGGFKQIFKATRSRAEGDSKSLMKDLGVKSGQGKSDIDKAESVISQAVSSNEIMSLAFASPKATKIKGKDAVTFSRKTSEISTRDATKYIYLTLLGAENAGLLRFEKGIKFVPKNEVTEATIIEL